MCVAPCAEEGQAEKELFGSASHHAIKTLESVDFAHETPIMVSDTYFPLTIVLCLSCVATSYSGLTSAHLFVLLCVRWCLQTVGFTKVHLMIAFHCDSARELWRRTFKYALLPRGTRMDNSWTALVLPSNQQARQAQRFL